MMQHGIFQRYDNPEHAFIDRVPPLYTNANNRHTSFGQGEQKGRQIPI